MLSYLFTSFIFWCVVAALIGLKIYIKFTTGKCICEGRVQGKTVVITGGNTGIGKAIAFDLARRGAKVILGCRNLEKGRKARDEIIAGTKNSKISVLHLDLTSLTSVRRFAFNVRRIESRLDVLINNAGACGLGHKITADKLLAGMQVNHFAPFLLTNLLIAVAYNWKYPKMSLEYLGMYVDNRIATFQALFWDLANVPPKFWCTGFIYSRDDIIKFSGLLRLSAPSRIIMVSSWIHRCAKLDLNNLNAEKSFSDARVYARSKLANVLMANELSRRLHGTGVTANSVNPGFVASELLRHIPPALYTLDADEGAQTAIHLAISEELQGVSGKYFSDCEESIPSPSARDARLAKELWEKSEECVKLKPMEKYL